MSTYIMGICMVVILKKNGHLWSNIFCKDLDYSPLSNVILLCIRIIFCYILIYYLNGTALLNWLRLFLYYRVKFNVSLRHFFIVFFCLLKKLAFISIIIPNKRNYLLKILCTFYYLKYFLFQNSFKIFKW